MRAIAWAFRGDLDAAGQVHDRALRAALKVQSAQIEAYNNLNRAWLRFIGGRWTDAIEAASKAAIDGNFNVEAWWIAANAEAAGDLPEELDRAIHGLSQPSCEGPVAEAMLLVAKAARSTREGHVDDARRTFAEAIARMTSAGSTRWIAVWQRCSDGRCWPSGSQKRPPRRAGPTSSSRSATRAASWNGIARGSSLSATHLLAPVRQSRLRLPAAPSRRDCSGASRDTRGCRRPLGDAALRPRPGPGCRQPGRVHRDAFPPR